MAQFIQHWITPVVGQCGEQTDLDQLPDRQENGVEQAWGDHATTLGIKPGRRSGVRAQAIGVTDDGPPALPPAAELERGNRAASVDPDAEQFAGDDRPRLLGTGQLQQGGQRLTEGQPFQPDRRGGTLLGIRGGHRRAEEHPRAVVSRRDHRRLQAGIAADRLDRLRLLRRGHRPDQQLRGVLRGRWWRTPPPRSGKHQAPGDHQRHPKAQVPTRLTEDVGQSFAEIVACKSIYHEATITRLREMCTYLLSK
jgi:hypothetical protein